MKKIVFITVVIIVLLILFFPYHISSSDDGGSTNIYTSLIMNITTYKPTQIVPRQHSGTVIRVFGKEIFNDVKNYYYLQTIANYKEKELIDTTDFSELPITLNVSSLINLMPSTAEHKKIGFSVKIKNYSKDDYFDNYETIQLIFENSIVPKNAFHAFPNEIKFDEVYTFALNCPESFFENYQFKDDIHDLIIVVKDKNTGTLYKKSFKFRINAVY